MFFRAFFAATFSLLLSIPSQAVLVTTPTSLAPNAEYRLAFVTTARRDGTSTNIADYNSFVTSAANAVPELLALATTWTTIASTSSIDARDNTRTNPSIDGIGVPIYLLNDTRLANDNADLWDGTLLNPWVRDNGTFANDLIRSGSLSTGVKRTDYPVGNTFASIGAATITGLSSGTWINAGDVRRNTNLISMYAVSDVLSVAAVVPEPSAFLCIGLVGLGLVGWKKLIANRSSS